MDYDTWLTTTPEDMAHDDECCCDKCHSIHVENGNVFYNAEFMELKCCKDLIEYWYSSGEKCRIHPDSYCEAPAESNGMVQYCEGCEHEKEEKE